MKDLVFEKEINASPEQIWDAITKLEKYRIWTAVFHKGSYFDGGWNKGDKIKFLIVNKAGIPEGMTSEIAESNFPNFISIRHLGFISNGQEDTESPEVKSWAPAYENYTIEEIAEGHSRIRVDAETDDKYVDMFTRIWPEALDALKSTAEMK